MNNITHRIGIKAPADKIYKLLTTDSGLSQWWTNDVSGAAGVGSIIKFRFNGGGPDFKITTLIPNKVVRWKHSGHVPEAWAGTEILFELSHQGKHSGHVPEAWAGTEILFELSHQGKHSGHVPEAWAGTEILFELSHQGEQTFVRFTHSCWKEPTDFMAHCSMKWAVFMLSLKDLVETGKGQPFPEDVQIDHS